MISSTQNLPSIEPVTPDRVSEFGQSVERAIRQGVRYLKSQQRGDGTWSDVENEAKTGTTSLVTLALLKAGEKVESPAIQKALDSLRAYGPNELKSTYAIALQTMVFAAAEPELDKSRIANNAAWLEQAQIKPTDPVKWAGSWTYSNSKRTRPGDNSNTQYALLGLNAASEVGVAVKPAVWDLARTYWETSQKRSGAWAYTPIATNQSASMTCAGVSSLIITGLHRSRGQESLTGETIQNCGKGRINGKLQAGTDWLAEHFQVDQNFGNGQQWKFYYLTGLERVGRLAGIRFFGRRDWFREGALELVHEQHKLGGFWAGALAESEKLLATSFALLFLGRGRSPVLINKLFHAPVGDWNNDPDDVRNIVNIVSRDRKRLLTWQVADPEASTVQELLLAPILFFNGHHAPQLKSIARRNLRESVERGGFLFAEACCGSKEFDRGFKQLMTEIFPEREYALRLLSKDHPVWHSRHLLSAGSHPLWGIQIGGKTAVIYSPEDLSCYWNQSDRQSSNPAVVKAIKVGQSVIEYATGGKLPPEKLSVR